MRMSAAVLRAPRVALVAAVAIAGACSSNEETLGGADLSAGLIAGVELSSTTAAPGERVAIAVRADLAGEGNPLGVLQGAVRYDAARLTYVGQAPAAGSVEMVNASEPGRLRFVSVNGNGLAERAVTLVFEVRAAGYAGAISYAHEVAAVDADHPIRRFEDQGVVPATDLALPTEVAALDLAAWTARVSEALPAGERLQGVPGQYLLDLKYGNANLDASNLINALDVLPVANAAVGNQELIIGTDSPNRDLVVAANVRPSNGTGLGEPNDPVPPGREADGSRKIDALDVLPIAQEAVGGSQAIVGELVPGRGAAATATKLIAAGTYTDTLRFFKDTLYILEGLVRIGGQGAGDSAGVLIIEPGTRVEGSSTVTPAALFIQRNGRIYADGTALEPIVFSCNAATKAKGCWGGIFIGGNAPINNGTATSPAVRNSAGGCFEKQGEGNAPFYGGCDVADTSGVLRYVRVEYAGYLLSLNNELNGITSGGVGSGTVFEYLQVHAGLDDGFEIFGGTHDVKYLYTTAISDDGFDFTFGWNGRAQFIVIQMDSLDSDKGFEVDNTETAGTFNTLPRTVPTIFNVTIVGRKDPAATTGAAGNNVNDLLHIRRGARPVLRNFLLANGRRALDIDDPETCDQINADFQLTQSVMLGNASTGNSDTDPTCAPYAGGTTLEADFITDAANGNVVSALPADSVLASPFNVSVPDFRPKATTPVSVGGGATPPAGGFFDVTATYRGALAPRTSTAGNIPWYSGWTRGWQSSSQP